MHWKAFLVLFVVAALLWACGDESTRVVHDPISIADEFSDIPECSEDNEGERVLVKEDSTIYTCVDGEWISTAGNFDKLEVSLDTLSGYSQKGPFLKGSMVYLYELSDGRTLKQTNGNFTSVITSDDGRYRFSARNLVSQYVLLIVEGNFRNEVTGKPTSTSIRLQAYSDILTRKSANVNLLTHLEHERVYNLVTRNKMRVKTAKQQAQAEILNAFHVDTTGLKGFGAAEDLDVFGKTDADAVLLAVSILLQGDSSETALSVLLTEILEDMAEDGEWNGAKAEKTKMRIADWAMAADTAGRLATFRKNVKSWGLSDTVPGFEKYVRHFWYQEYDFDDCSKKREGEVVAAKNKLSSVYGTEVRFVCKGGKWKAASDLEKDTYQWELGSKDGESKLGDVTKKKYFYDKEKKAWREASNVENALGFCSKKIETDESKNYGEVDSAWYFCRNREWDEVDEMMLDTLTVTCSSKSLGKKIDGAVNKSNQYYCTEKGWVSLMDWSWDIPKEVRLNPDIKYDSITDPRDNKVYKVVTVGKGKNAQTWFAENLNYADSVATPSLKGRNWCYDDVEANCDVGGRLYTWSAAIDSVKLATDETHPMRCGVYLTCVLPEKVQGICPAGWHVPTYMEWRALNELVGSETTYGMFMTQNGWSDGNRGTDVVGFSVFPSGAKNINGKFSRDGALAAIWTSTESDVTESVILPFLYNWVDDSEDGYLTYNKAYGISVRCLKDSE